MQIKKTAAVLAALTGLIAPAAADAHVTVHPNVVPQGAFAVLNVRVPNETDDADTTKVSVQLPEGVAFLSTAPVPGWKVKATKTKLATPLKTEFGEFKEAYTQVDFTGGKLAPGQFIEFPLSIGVPGKEGDTLTFKALQTYSDGEVVRWIGPADDEHPAPTVTVSKEGGLIEDSTGEHGATHDDAAAEDTAAHEEATAETQPAAAPAATIIRKEESSNGLAIAALIVGGLGLAVGAAAFATRKS